ncbi:MAG: TIGR02266 family protein [Myxococcales bacterium]|nr:TIGR02266 family protein [Myxococcales bacterium]
MSYQDDQNPQLDEFLFFQEDKLGRLEAEMQNHESNLLKRERAFIGRRLALSDYYEWLVEEEQKLVEASLRTASSGALLAEFHAALPVEVTVERTDYKTLEVCQRSRRLLIEIRRKCVEEREAVLLRRNQEIERAEEDLSRFESMLKQREDVIQRFRKQADEQVVDVSAIAGVTPHGTAEGSLEAEPDSADGSAPQARAEGALSADDGRQLEQKREHARVALELVVSTVSAHNFFTGFSKNISLGGLFVATHELRPVGTEIALKFRLPGGDLIEATGEVQWIQEPQTGDGSAGMGIRFIDLGDVSKKAIERFIAHYREPIFYDL